MKINLGCGGVYKKNYVNIDFFNNTIADKIMDATDLKFEDNSVEEIYCSQLIEHLGLARSIYSLSECFRVLRPNCRLIIETPDLKKSFEKFLNGDRETRKYVLPWIFGIDSPGMQHKFCYPEDLLEETLQSLGFINMVKEYIEIDPEQPILKITCEKTQNYLSYQYIAGFRKRLIENNLVDLNDQILSMEIEDLIIYFQEKLKNFFNDKNESLIEDITIKGSIMSAEITNIFLSELEKKDEIQIENLKKNIDVLKAIIGVDFSKILIDYMKKKDGFIGENEELIENTMNHSRKIINDLLNLNSNDRSYLLNNLQVISDDLDDSNKISFFSEKMIILKSNKIFQQGAKEFILSNYQEAVNYFEEAKKLYRDQILTYWNLARLYSILKNYNKSEENINYAISLLSKIEYPDKDLLYEKLNQEKNDLKKINNYEPVYFL